MEKSEGYMPETVAPLRCLPRRPPPNIPTCQTGMAMSKGWRDGWLDEWKEAECLTRLNECAKMCESNARLQKGDKSTIGRTTMGMSLPHWEGPSLRVDTQGRQMMERTIYRGRRVIRGIGLLLLLPLLLLLYILSLWLYWLDGGGASMNLYFIRETNITGRDSYYNWGIGQGRSICKLNRRLVLYFF